MKRSIFLALGISVFCASTAYAQVEPGGDAPSTLLATVNPDEYAWQLFFYMSRPALAASAGVADGNKQFGDATDMPVVWETWALESGGTASEVYKPDGSNPGTWEHLPRSNRQLILDANREREAVLSSSSLLRPRFDALAPASQEVRANKAMFDFIVSKGMYSLDGMETLLEGARNSDDRGFIKFPAGAKEIKAQWNPIREADKPRYLWREAVIGGRKLSFGLVALHIITKDLPNWVWIDFGHIDCETGAGACDTAWLRSVLGNSIADQEPALTPAVDNTTRGPNAPSGSDGIRDETKGTVWQNYILRGTQISFTTAFGSPTILSNPVIENGFQQSSCITCHARAAIGSPFKSPNGNLSPKPNTLSPGDPELGSPNQTLFGAGAGLGAESIQYLQTDFIWSAPFRAQRVK